MAIEAQGLIGARLAHYRILAPLGEGGMGQVFVAEDTRLHRRVALKLLPPALAADSEKRNRFIREARVLAALNHPAIVTIHSVERAPTGAVPADDSTPSPGFPDHHYFFTMELVEGDDLDRVVPSHGLPLERFYALAFPLLEGLSAAHAAGVTHRDLKPSNIMVTATGVKILDFGLAKSSGLMTAADEDLPTDPAGEEGGLIGTVSYMAPEQILGGRIDPRTDIFSVACVLFEMATGKRPFDGQTPAEQIAKVLRDDVSPLSDVRPDYPSRLDRLFGRCLSKDPEARPQTAGEVLDQLKAIHDEKPSEVPPEKVQSIAVLPFADMSVDQDQAYFCDGIAEELINALNRVEGLQVASRSSSFRFREEDLDAREIGTQLGVNTVLEGSVRKAGDQLRITVALVKVIDGYDLWSKRFDRKLEDIFLIQEQIAQKTVEALEITLSAEEERRIRKPTAATVDAYDYYLRGRMYFYQYSRRGMEFALEMFERAIETDPAFVRAFAGIADCHSFLYANAGRTPEHLRSALDASKKALEIDPGIAESHVARGVALSYSDRSVEAKVSFETAVRLDPRLFEAHYFYARHCFVQGQRDRAIRHYERAEQIRPDDYLSPLLVAQIHDDLGDSDSATAARHRGIRLAEDRLRYSPDDTRALYMEANALVMVGQRDLGLARARRARELDPEDPMLLYNLACVYSLAGQAGPALDCLAECVTHGFSYFQWAEHDSNLDAIRDHSRYRALIDNESTDSAH